LPLPAHREHPPLSEEWRQHGRELDRIKKTNWLNAINRRLWKYQFRFNQIGLDLEAVRDRADDRLAYLDQRLGWAEAMIAQLSDLEKSQRPLQEIANYADTPINVAKPFSAQAPTQMSSPQRQRAIGAPQVANKGLPALDHLRDAYENYRPYATIHYGFEETKDPDVPQSMINHVHGWLANLQNKQSGLWSDTLEIGSNVAEKARVKKQRIADIRRKYAQIYSQCERTMEAKSKALLSRGGPNVKELILTHEAAIAAARPHA
jgi:hypothetical protein